MRLIEKQRTNALILLNNGVLLYIFIRAESSLIHRKRSPFPSLGKAIATLDTVTYFSILFQSQIAWAICSLNLCVAQHHLPDRATSFGASHHHLCAAQHHCTAGAYRGGVAVISRPRSGHILGKANATLDIVTYFSPSDPSVGYASLEDGTSPTAPKW